jgi:hypothetical protein
MNYLKHCITLFLILSLSACASLSKDECLQADWYEIGHSDGMEGLKSSRLSEHNKACIEYHVIPDKIRYSQGRQDGLLRYCTPENGLQEGLDGHSYQKVCPYEIESAFLKNYRKGKAIYELEQEIERHQSRLSTVQTYIKNNNDNKQDKDKKKLTYKEIREYEKEIAILITRIEEKQKRLYYMKGKSNIPM